MTILITGGAGFIGSNFVLDWFAHNSETLVNIDKLTYAGNKANLKNLPKDAQYHFIHADIQDRAQIEQAFLTHKPRAIINFAAESHVDRSITGPAEFIATNICGCFQLLEVSREYFKSLKKDDQARFVFMQISTDEVYGSLNQFDAAFTEKTAYAPNSPYSASKASADMLVRAYAHTYALPTLTTNCSNNYGPFQFPEKFIPVIITNALKEMPIPIYGDGCQVRDWLYVKDHCSAIRAVLAGAKRGEVYNVGAENEWNNLAIAHKICEQLDAKIPRSNSKPYSDLIRLIQDRPGHDRRYAIDNTKIKTDLGWSPSYSFKDGLKQTIDWYLQNQDWVKQVQAK